MIQFDILGGKTLIKEHKKPLPAVKKSASMVSREKRQAEIALKEEKAKRNPLFMTIEKQITLKPSQIVHTTNFKRETKSQSANSRQNLKACDGEFNGYMSANTSRNVQRIVQNWLTSLELNKSVFEKEDYRNKPYVTFVTLTLPAKQVHHDNYIKEHCLEPFLKWLRDSEQRTKRKGGAGVDAYLWRAESQKNGNLHFHVICDRWIDHDKVREKWNSIVEKLGYVTMYRQTQKYIHRHGFKFREEQAKEQIESLMYITQQCLKDGKTIPDTKYKDFPIVRETINRIVTEHNLLSKKDKKANETYGLGYDTARMFAYRMQEMAYNKGVAENWSNPNSTDIHKLSNIENISAYITKYVSKKDGIFPKLGPNQKVLQNGNLGKYIFTLREGGDWENAMDWQDEIKYEVKFESRKVRGRIWGKSRNLSDTHEEGVKINAPKITTEIKVLYDDEVFGRRQTVVAPDELSFVVQDYVEAVKEIVPEAEQKRLREVIDSEYCEVIPLGKYATRINHRTKKREKFFKVEKQIDYLEKLNPAVKTRYLEHYSNIFTSIYGSRFKAVA